MFTTSSALQRTIKLAASLCYTCPHLTIKIHIIRCCANSFFVNILVFFTLRYLFKLYAWSNAKYQRLFIFVYEFESILFKIWTNVYVPNEIEFDQRKKETERKSTCIYDDKKNKINGCICKTCRLSHQPLKPKKQTSLLSIFS